MVRPCVAREFHRSGGFAVLHQCIRPLIGARCAPGHHGYQRACVLISGQASIGPFGSPGFAGAGKTDPPSRLILSQTSAGKLGYVIDRSCRVSSFVRTGGVPSSRPAVLQRAARKGRQGRPSLYLASCFGAARPRLDGRGHGARIRPAGIKSQMRVPC
jgi:predicted metal-binding protein